MKNVRYFGNYVLLGEIARGGMGVVYFARQTSLDRRVALKMIASGLFATPAEVERFRLEARAAANLDHHNIVPIYEIGQHEGQHYFSMKLIEGENLADRLAGSGDPLSDRDRIVLLAKVARAVHHAHEHGVLHRDLKPSNILLDAANEPYVTDFGLAKNIHGNNKLTASGATMGTPAYMAPEQALGDIKHLTTAVDIYSLGAILYELLTGQPPFGGGTPLDTLRLKVDQEPPRPSSVDSRVDCDLEKICLRCLQRDPRSRYGSAEAVAQDLEHWLAQESIPTPPTGVWARPHHWPNHMRATIVILAVLSLVALVGGAVKHWLRRESSQTAAASAGGSHPPQLPQTVVIEAMNHLVWIPPGSFTMGSPSTEPGRRSDEQQHRVTLTEGFWMSRYEVTQGEYVEVMKSNPSYFPGEPNRPVESVTWNEAAAYCAALTAGDASRGRLPAGYEYRLPTEAEWEYACRAGTTTPFHYGTELLSGMANIVGAQPGHTISVGSYATNAWGLYDMHGNVWEWCQDWWHSNSPSGSVTNPLGPVAGSTRVIRGGSFAYAADECRSAYRDFNYRGNGYPSSRFYDVGLRVVLAKIRERDRTMLARSNFKNRDAAVMLPPQAPETLANPTRLPATDAKGPTNRLAWIPPGIFTMGSPITEEGRQGNEEQHHVTLSQGFWMGRYEVTQGEYWAVMSTNPSTRRLGANFPVETVRWDEATNYCGRLTTQEATLGRLPQGYAYRLPTEAEWEYACRAGTKGPFSFGPTLDATLANVDPKQPYPPRADKLPDPIEQGHPTPVGTYPSNRFGLFDMHGNVFEWCLDWCDSYPTGPATDPRGPTISRMRVVRGGAWDGDCVWCRSAARGAQPPHGRSGDLGFRVVLAKIQRSDPSEQPRSNSSDRNAVIGFQPRVPVTPTSLIDLSAFFNADLRASWQNHKEAGNNLALLPTLIQDFAGVKFDIRGIIQISSDSLKTCETNYPTAITNVPVRFPCQRLHFLVGTGWFDTPGTQIGRFVLHLADGSQQVRPLRYGKDVRNWHFFPEETEPAGGPEPIWKGPQQRWRERWPERGVRLYKVTWENPRPQVKVETLDFISAMASAAPFLIAVTAEE